MEVVSTVSEQMEKDISNVWVDPKILAITYIFVYEGNLDRDFLEVGLATDWGVVIPYKDINICKKI